MTEQTEFTGTTISEPLVLKLKKLFFKTTNITENGQDLEIMRG
jgi:hypothetical protein